MYLDPGERRMCVRYTAFTSAVYCALALMAVLEQPLSDRAALLTGARAALLMGGVACAGLLLAALFSRITSVGFRGAPGFFPLRGRWAQIGVLIIVAAYLLLSPWLVVLVLMPQ